MKGPAISLIMPTIDWEQTFQRCVRAAAAGLGPSDQLLVVFDGQPPAPPSWLLESKATLLQTGVRRGPAAARNLAAAHAQEEILLFVDADVELHTDAIARIRAHFAADPGLAGVFGSYDATPAAPGLVSRYRNLLHHHTHTSHPGPACTFWAGCGAVCRDRFLELGGFDAETYPQPCIEDIEFGLRLHEAGGRILLDPTIQGTHHKSWNLPLMLRTDIHQRAIPWSRLLLQRRNNSTSLNLNRQARLSSLLSLVTVLTAGVLPFAPSLWHLPLLTLGLIVLLNQKFYHLCFQKGGSLFCLAAIGLHGLYFLYSLLSFALVVVQNNTRNGSRSLV